MRDDVYRPLTRLPAFEINATGIGGRWTDYANSVGELADIVRRLGPLLRCPGDTITVLTLESVGMEEVMRRVRQHTPFHETE